MVISTDSVLQSLKDGTYSLDTLLPSRFFKTKIPDKRKRFPSVELLEVPTGSTTTQESTDFVRTFNVTIFLGLRGGTTTGQTKDITNLETLEEEILTVLENTPILEHKVTINDRKWSRDYNNNELRPYIMSTLTIVSRQISAPTGNVDGILIFDTSKSVTNNNPLTDYQYSKVFNTDIGGVGYRDFDEFVNDDPNPRRYAGGFEGSFITNIRVNDSDLGSTGDKLNQLNTLKANGEKPTIAFIYTDKTDETPITINIQNSLIITVDNVKQMYKSGENTIFRVIGKLTSPNTITTV